MSLKLTNAKASVLCTALLLGPYLVYVRDAGRVSALLSAKTPLRKPLAELPLTLGGWTGRDLPQDEEIARVAGADDQLTRIYRSPLTGEVLSAYLAYYGDARPRVGHHPEVCYPAFGWRKEQKSEERVEARPPSRDASWPVSLFQFRRGTQRVTVVSVYISGGRVISDRVDVDALAHELLAKGSGRHYLRVMLSFQGSPPKERVMQLAGRFLSELLPALNAHLPEPLRGGSGAQQR